MKSRVPRLAKEDLVLKKAREESYKSPPRSARRKVRDPSNPFTPPDVTDLFSVGTTSKRSNIPTSRRERRNLMEKRYNLNPIDSDKKIAEYEGRRRIQHPNDLISEQREVFLSNLLIDRHKKELERLNYMKNTKKSKLEDMEFSIEEDQNRSRTIKKQLEMTRNRAKFNLDEQTQKRKQIETKLIKKKSSVSDLKHEQSVLEQKRDNYRLCKELLGEMEKYYGKKLENEKEFLDVFDIMEQDNLFLIQNKKQMEVNAEDRYLDLTDEIDNLKYDIKLLNEELKNLNTKKESITKINETSQDTTELDKKLMDLQKQISGTFFRCFGTTGDSENSLTMLSMIESKLENMLKKLAAIEDKEAVAKEIKKYNNKRRKEFREAKNEKKARELEANKRAMLERATKPVKPRTGRPVIERIITGRTKKVNIAKLEAERDERERLENLLFGDSIFD